MTDPMPENPDMGTVHHLDAHRPARTTTPINLTKPTTTDDDPITVPLEGVVLPPPGGEAVDRVDNPLADWLTVPDVPILPPWARSAAALRANAGAAVRMVRYQAGFHAVRLPKYSVKVTWLAAKGSWRVSVRLWPVLSCHEHTQLVRALAVRVSEKGEADTAIALRAAHRARTVARRWRFGTAIAVAAGAGMALTVAATPVLITVSAVLLGILAVVGRKGAEVPLLDRADVPLPPRPVRTAAQRRPPRRQPAQDQPRRRRGPAGLLCDGAGAGREGLGVHLRPAPRRWENRRRRDRQTRSLGPELGVDEIQVIMSRVRAVAGRPRRAADGLGRR